VSKSTVQREAARSSTGLASGRPPSHTLPSAPAETRPPAQGMQTPTSPTLQPSGKDVAEAFFAVHVSNPLLRKDKR
jgi:hypothetical protein